MESCVGKFFDLNLERIFDRIFSVMLSMVWLCMVFSCYVVVKRLMRVFWESGVRMMPTYPASYMSTPWSVSDVGRFVSGEDCRSWLE